MEDLLAEFLSFPPVSPVSDAEYDKQAKRLVKAISDVPHATLLDKGPDGESLINAFTPSQNTIVYLAILSANIEALRKKSGSTFPADLLPDGPLFKKIVTFLEDFDPIQVRYVGSTFRTLLDTVMQAAEESSQQWIAVPIIRDAILRLDPTSSTLTTTHIQFVYLCLRLKLYKDALPVLDHDIFNVPLPVRRPGVASVSLASSASSATYLTPATGLTNEITTREYLQNFLYSATVYIALRKWQRALLLLEIVLVAPSPHASSMIQVEAYKKYILIGLLLNGNPISPPRTINSQALKSIKALARPYDVIADAFGARDFQRLQGDLDAGHREGIWQKDNNLGLMHEVVKAFRKFAVLRLAKTFAALPISEVARRTSPDPTDLLETEQYVSDLIVTGDLKATISKDGPPTLRFLTADSVTQTEVQLQAEIAKKKARLAMLLELISNNDHRLEVSREYVEHLHRLKKSKDDEEKASRNLGTNRKGEPSGTQDIIDEDVMADA